MRYSSTDVYQHEMPGGQYTNLKFQAASLGLGDSWDKVQQSYAAANRCVGCGVGGSAARHAPWQTRMLLGHVSV
jgi:pyruvate carboxylase